MKRMVRLLGGVALLVLFIYDLQYLVGLEKELVLTSKEEKKAKLFHQNPDVYAWLTVEGTRIDYPVAQHPTDDAYYLSHDLDGNATYYGAIFTELVNTKTFNDPMTIIYGHAITDGSMFGSLDAFADPSFFEKHQKIRIETVDKEYEYEIMAAHSYSDDHLFHTFNLGSQAGMDYYLATLQERSLAHAGSYRQLNIDSHKDTFLILSTCDATSSDQRYVLTARLTNLKERKPS